MYAALSESKLNSKLEAKKYAIQLATTTNGCGQPPQTNLELAKEYYAFLIEGLDIPDVENPMSGISGMFDGLKEMIEALKKEE